MIWNGIDVLFTNLKWVFILTFFFHFFFSKNLSTIVTCQICNEVSTIPTIWIHNGGQLCIHHNSKDVMLFDYCFSEIAFLRNIIPKISFF